MSIEILKRVLIPPSSPVENRTTYSWEEVQSQIGTVLPNDYKDFITEFGTGRIDGFVWVFNPFSANRHLKLQEQIKVRLDALKELKPVFGKKFPFGAFPEPEGLLPFAATDNGDCLFWLTNANPNRWPVIVCDSRGPEWERFDLGMSQFLAAVLKKQRACGIFPEDFPSNNPTFLSKC